MTYRHRPWESESVSLEFSNGFHRDHSGASDNPSAASHNRANRLDCLPYLLERHFGLLSFKLIF